MKKKLKYLFPLVFLAACTGKKAPREFPQNLHDRPLTIALNTSDGYAVNVLTGDSIEPLINSAGDTVRTGVPLVIEGKRVPDSGLARPKSYPVPSSDRLLRKKARSFVHPIPEKRSVLPIHPDSLKKIPLLEIAPDDKSHYLLSGTGDTIPTGVPISIEGEKVHIIHTPARSIRELATKDASIGGLQFLDIEQGMLSSDVSTIRKDRNGNLWFATWGGVSRFDGHTLTHFTEKEGLGSNVVKSMIEDRNGNLWFGTMGGGISRYNGQFITRFTQEQGLSNDQIMAILEDRNGNLWFGTMGGGVIKYDGKSFINFTMHEGLSNNFINSITEDKEGNLWFGTRGGVCKFDGRSFTHLTTNDGLSTSIILSILEDRDGNLWIGTYLGGLIKYDGKSLTFFTTEEGLSDNSVMSAHEDEGGNIWFGTWGGGVSVYNGTSFTRYTEEEGLSNNYIWSILEEQNGKLWFATSGGGVNVLEVEAFRQYTEKDGLSSQYVNSILEDRNGNLWFATSGEGVCKYDGESYTHYKTDDGLSSNMVLTMTEDHNGDLWFGTADAGAVKFDGKFFTHFSEEQGLSSYFIYSILEDRNENLWFGVQNGVTKYEPPRAGKSGSFTHFTEKEGFNNMYIHSVLEDRAGNIWFIGSNGVHKFDGKHFTHYTEKEGLSDDQVLSIAEDGDGSLWFGSQTGGLTRFDGAFFMHFTEKQGLSDNVVQSITLSEGMVWAASEKGLNLIIPKQDSGNVVKSKNGPENDTFNLFNFTIQDGLTGSGFMTNSTLLDSRNRLWWGGGKTVLSLSLDKFEVAEQAPVVHLRQLEINEKFRDFRNLSDEDEGTFAFAEVQSFENYPLDLVLPYHLNHLYFRFQAIDWSAPHKIRYSYIMEGLDTNWSAPDSESFADYRNLPYGKYTFKIRAIGESGKWSDAFSYTFTITPPWWHTWWARLGYVCAAILLILGTVRWRTAALVRRQKELEIEVDNATREIRKQKEEVEKEKERSEELLLNILPEETAQELKEKGYAEAKLMDQVSVLFTDFKGFTSLSEKVTPKELVSDLHECFSAFDHICESHGIEKIKTIGDAYMAAGGLPSPSATHAKDVVLAALEMAEVIIKGKEAKIAAGAPYFEVRIGVHTGPVVAGIVGVKKFQYDIWGDTVNTASRMESNGAVGRVNISRSTYEMLKDDPDLHFESRGKIDVKGKGELEMYFVSRSTWNTSSQII